MPNIMKIKGFVDRGNTPKADELEIIHGTGISKKGVFAIDFDQDLELREGDVITLVLRVE